MRGTFRKSVSVSCAAASAAVSAPLAAEVVETSASGFVTRDTARVAATPLETWLALIKPGDWWNDNHSWSGDASNMTLVPQAGGCFCEAIPGDDGDSGFAMDGSSTHMTVIQAFPLRVLRMRGGLGPLQGEPATGILTITLKEIEGGTRILWEYNVGGPMRFEIGEISNAVDGVMSQQLKGLQTHLGILDGDDGENNEETEQSTVLEMPPILPSGESAEPVTHEQPSLEDQIDALAEGRQPAGS